MNRAPRTTPRPLSRAQRRAAAKPRAAADLARRALARDHLHDALQVLRRGDREVTLVLPLGALHVAYVVAPWAVPVPPGVTVLYRHRAGVAVGVVSAECGVVGLDGREPPEGGTTVLGVVVAQRVVPTARGASPEAAWELVLGAPVAPPTET